MASRAPAPGELTFVERFLRTRNEVRDGASLSAWLAREGLARSANDALARRALRLREALRELLWTNNGGPPASAASAAVNAEARRLGFETRITADGRILHGWRAAGPQAFLGRVLAAMLTAIADGSWSRMKACAAADCRYAFYDRTKNRSARWCDVAGCGPKLRMRAYRRRAGRPGRR
jgi:predicted RNA-binding Zn ribbon-like protein